MVKGLPAVVEVDHGIDAAVNDQKSYEEKAGSAHREFLTYGRSEEVFPGHKANVIEEFVVQKYVTKLQ